MAPLISIITPCYNGETFIDGYFNSILNQTYKNLELIFINDGSTDRTEEIVLSYREKLEQAGIQFIYIDQENQGQAAAINQGLRLFHGDYFIWPDSDDLLSPDSIEKRVQFLIKHPDFSMVRSNADFFDYDTKEYLYRASNHPNRFHTDIFMDLILEESYCYCGCYMIKREAFLSIYPNRQIKVFSAGQNWQLLIPLTGRFLCGYIDEDLYHIAVRKGSHSRQNYDYSHQIARQSDLKEILLSSIAISGRTDQDYSKIVEIKYIRRYLNIALSEQHFDEAKSYYKELKRNKAVKNQDRQTFLQTFSPKIGKLYTLWLRGCGKIKRTLENIHL